MEIEKNDNISICVVHSYDPNHDDKHVNYFESKRVYIDFIRGLDEYQKDEGIEYGIYISFGWLKRKLLQLENNILFDLKVYENNKELLDKLRNYNKGVEHYCDALNRIICNYVKGEKYD